MKWFLKGGVLAASAVAAVAAMAQPKAAQAADFSCSTAKLIVPWKAGGGTHVIFSIFEKIINESGVKPRIKVVSISGQGGNKGAKEAKRAKADGCTLFAIHQSAITSFLNGRVDFTYDAFDPVARLTSTPDMVGASGKVPWKSFDDMIKAAKAAPGSIKTGATFGSTSQFMWLLMEDLTGVKFSYVPFDGTRQRMTALLADTIKLGTVNVAASRKQIEAGDLKAFAIAAEKRSKHLPNIPTLKELGVDLVYTLDRGIVAPKGTPKDKIKHWSKVFKKASENPDLIKQLDAKGTDVAWVGPEAYAKWFKGVYDAHEKVAIKIGMFKR